MLRWITVLSTVAVGAALGFPADWSLAEDGTGQVSSTADLSWEEEIEAAMNKRVQLVVVEWPLRQVVADLERQVGNINIRLDDRAFEDMGMSTDTPVTQRLGGSLRDVLHLTLRDLGLTYILADGVLLITTPGDYHPIPVTKVLDVLDLIRRDQPVAPGESRCDADPLIDLITQTIEPNSWQRVGGERFIIPHDGMLIVSQPRDNLAEIEHLLAAIRRARQLCRDYKDKAPPVTSIALEEDPLQAIRAALSTKGDYDFQNVPLEDVATRLGQKFGVKIMLDRRAIQDDGIRDDLRFRVTFSASGMTLEHALRHMLRPLGLICEIDYCNCLRITTFEECRGDMLVTRVYPVADLVEGRRLSVEDTCLPREKAKAVYYGLADGERTAEKELVDIVICTVASNTWSHVGGPGSIILLDSVCVVVQTEDAHQEIEHLFTELRQAKAAARISPDRSKDYPPDEMHLVVYFVETVGDRPASRPAEDESTDKLGPGQSMAPANNTGEDATSTIPKPMSGAVPHEPPSDRRFHHDELLEVIQELVAPESWNDENVYARAAPGRLIIRHNAGIHEEIRAMLSRLGVRYQKGAPL